MHLLDENGKLTITITGGAAAGTWTKQFPSVDESGLIFLGHLDLPNGQHQAVKIRASDHPNLVAEINRRAEISKAEAAARFEAESGQRALDAKMAQAGFEAAGNAGGLWNRLIPVNGNNF